MCHTPLHARAEKRWMRGAKSPEIRTRQTQSRQLAGLYHADANGEQAREAGLSRRWRRTANRRALASSMPASPGEPGPRPRPLPRPVPPLLGRCLVGGSTAGLPQSRSQPLADAPLPRGELGRRPFPLRAHEPARGWVARGSEGALELPAGGRDQTAAAADGEIQGPGHLRPTLLTLVVKPDRSCRGP
jgi:hypothetical protein